VSAWIEAGGTLLEQMRTTEGWLVVGVHGAQVLLYGKYEDAAWVDTITVEPDGRDPGTLGIMLGEVRRVWGSDEWCSYSVVVEERASYVCENLFHEFTGATEEEALAAAYKAGVEQCQPTSAV
jgi:hypothetical protein